MPNLDAITKIGIGLSVSFAWAVIIVNLALR